VEARLQVETMMLKAKAEGDRIRRLAEDPAIQARFAPFLAKGRYIFNGGPTYQVNQSERAVPVSFGDMSRKGY
jgi:hypothetical protein